MDERQTCPLCGLSHGAEDPCPAEHGGSGEAQAATEKRKQTPPQGFAPGYYLRMALGIASFDSKAIHAAAEDPQAGLYGAAIWAIGQTAIFAQRMVPAARAAHMNWFAIGNAGLTILILDGGWMLAQYAICHAVGRWLFAARGTYAGIVRAMLMGALPTWLVVIPYAGLVMGALWTLAVLMRVFEQVDGIAKIHAFGLAFGTGVLFWIVALLLVGRPIPV